MKYVDFPQQNKVLTKPEGMTDKQCGSLSVHFNGEQCISCWQPDWKDRLRLLFGAKMWLWVWFGDNQPPVKLSTDHPWPKNAA